MNPGLSIQCALLGAATTLLVACAEDPAPPSLQQLLDDPNRLEATMVRCAELRGERRYDPECVNARQAVSVIEAREERARRDALEAESERKLEALRSSQEAATEARRQAEAAERMREEEEYHAQFGDTPPQQQDTGDELEANVPGAILPPDAANQEQVPVYGDPLPAGDDSNAPIIRNEPPEAAAGPDQ